MNAAELVANAHVADAVQLAAGTAVRALQAAEDIFSTLFHDQSAARAGVVGVARPPGVVVRRLVAVGCALLPAGDRGRYAEEWLSLLTEVSTRRARAWHVLSILRGAPWQAWALPRPLKPVPPT
ncbi:hypothetical protein E1264_32160 [Actinomadura sp. KC216]|nr:hypothetical protein E1264_32160 [Actinomadura sp. KC216]